MNEEIVKNLLEDFTYDNSELQLHGCIDAIDSTFLNLVESKSKFLIELRDLILKYNGIEG